MKSIFQTKFEWEKNEALTFYPVRQTIPGVGHGTATIE